MQNTNHQPVDFLVDGEDDPTVEGVMTKHAPINPEMLRHTSWILLAVASATLIACSARVGQMQGREENAADLPPADTGSAVHTSNVILDRLENEEVLSRDGEKSTVPVITSTPSRDRGQCPPSKCLAHREWGGSVAEAIEGTWCSCAGDLLLSIHDSSFQFCSSSRCGSVNPFTLQGSDVSEHYVMKGDRKSILLRDPRTLPPELQGLLILKYRHISHGYYLSAATDCSCFASEKWEAIPAKVPDRE